MDRTEFQGASRWSSSGSTLKVGQWVEIRPHGEILATLDAQGECDRMPFMPEMLAYVGRRFQVTGAAHKTCDTINRTGGRRLRDAAHIGNLRCSGAAHGGCQAECLLFWKSSWLRAVDGPSPAPSESDSDDIVAAIRSRLARNASSEDGADTIKYRCQATQLLDATEPLAWWDLRQYWTDVRTGNATPTHALSTLFLAFIFNLRRLPIGYRLSVWLYQRAHVWTRRQPDPHLQGAIANGAPTPDERLDLNVGEVVEVRGKDEIERTINDSKRNRGLQIDEEMTIYCGGRYKVASRVERIINEQSGEMMHFKNPCIVLDGVYCRGEYSAKRLLCPRKINAYWREAWLKRVSDAHVGVSARRQ